MNNSPLPLQISDEVLWQYLQGNLSGSDAESVENAIENSPELQSIVDDYLALQYDVIRFEHQHAFLPVSARSFPALTENGKNRSLKMNYKTIAIAAIFLSCVSALGVRLLIYSFPTDNCGSSLNQQQFLAPASYDNAAESLFVDGLDDVDSLSHRNVDASNENIFLNR